jgi:sigma-E factor negative regulatory protein RseA
MDNGTESLSMAEVVSALADGEGDSAAVAAVSAAWRDDAEVRARWHGYQLIGDAMRSDELAGRGRDAEFLKSLRVRLDREPVVLAPARPSDRVAARELPASGRARRWATPAAMAAGFMMVAGAVLVTRAPAPPAAQTLVQAAPAAVATPALTAPASSTVVAPALPSSNVKVANANAPAARSQEVAVPFQGVLLRDARMQQYFAAHQQFGGSTALGLPSAFLRNATFETPVGEAAGSR